jgi:hypothetical protein
LSRLAAVNQNVRVRVQGGQLVIAGAIEPEGDDAVKGIVARFQSEHNVQVLLPSYMN